MTQEQAEKMAVERYPDDVVSFDIYGTPMQRTILIQREAYLQGRTDLIQEIKDKLGVIVNTSKGDDVVMDVINLLKELK